MTHNWYGQTKLKNHFTFWTRNSARTSFNFSRLFITIFCNYRRERICNWRNFIKRPENRGNRPVGFVSGTLNHNERKWNTYSRVGLAIIHSINQFRPYLFWRKFMVITNHKPLVWFSTSTDPTSRITRRRLKLNCYDFDIVYRCGKKQCNADALPQNPVYDVPNDSDNNNIFNVQTRTRAGELPL